MTGKVFKKVAVFALTSVLWLMGATGYAQNRPISGTVVDPDGQPIIGASVMVIGNSRLGTVTDVNGAFSLSVPNNANLSVSCIGYTTQTVNVGNQTTFNFILAEDTEFLDETVVIGYGVQKKSDLTGSVASIRNEDIENRSMTNAAAALQGKAAGVQVLNYSGAPGATSEIRVRGYSSNSGNLGPLLIVDGLQVSNINYLDPDMIESMEILKDAASAAIYGAQAGNGVVLITTKSGSKTRGDGNVFYNFQRTFTSLAKPVEVLNAQDYIAYKRAQNLLTDEMLQNYWDGKTDTNWSEVTFGPAITDRHTIGVQGSTDRSNFYVALNYIDQDGIVRGDKDTYKRLSAQINGDFRVKSWLTVGTNTSLEKTATRSVSQHSDFGSVLTSTLTNDPLTVPYYKTVADLPTDMKNHYDAGDRILGDENGFFSVSKIAENDSGHPFIMRDNSEGSSYNINIRGTLYANFTPIKALTITSRFGYRIGQSYSTTYDAPYYANSMALRTTYSLSATSSSNYYYQWENFANYTKSFGKNTITAMAGMSFINNHNYSVQGSGSGTDILTGYAENFRYLSYLSNDATKSVSSSPGSSASLAYYGRLSWNYANRYNMQINFRADAYDSSKLSKVNRWGYFPSISAGWTITNEEFMKGIDKNILSFLKIRASWGKNGNINVLSGYQYDTTISYNAANYMYTVGSSSTTLGSYPSGLPNPDLEWEESIQTDFGIDARFLNNKLTIALDYFNKLTDGLLVSVAPVAEVGVGSTTINAGTVRNTGLELEFSWKDTIGDFSYNLNGNFSSLSNVVTYLDPTVSRIQGSVMQASQAYTAFEQGHKIWYFRAYDYLGVNRETGEAIFRDVDGNGVIDANDMTDVGCGIPDYTYGITLNAAYKNFDLTVFGTGVFGNEIMAPAFRKDRPRNNSLRYFYENMWTESNRDSILPSAIAQRDDIKIWASDANIFDGAYFKIKQIQLGYTLPTRIVKKVKMSSLRAFVSMDDWITFTSYPGFDPETASSGSANSLGMDRGSYPTSKKLVLGVNVKF